MRSVVDRNVVMRRIPVLVHAYVNQCSLRHCHVVYEGIILFETVETHFLSARSTY